VETSVFINLTCKGEAIRQQREEA